MLNETIVRYANRKMYSKEKKAYVELPYILDKIKQGLKVQVIDHVTKKDLTEITIVKAKFQEETRRLNGM